MIKLSKQAIYFCGKDRHFKRTSAKQLRDSSKGLEAIQKELQDSFQEAQKLGEDAINYRVKARQLMEQETITDEHLKLVDEYESKAKKLDERVEKQGKELENKVETLNDDLAVEFEKIAIQFLEPMEPGEFTENYDNRDLLIVKNMGMFYDMYMYNFSEAKIDARIRQLLEADHDSKLPFPGKA